MYCVIGSFAGELSVKLITNDRRCAVETLEKSAVDYVCDEIGRKNFINTLSPDYASKQLSEYPVGLVLKKRDNPDDKIEVWKNSQQSGWTGTYIKSELVGCFCILQAENVITKLNKCMLPGKTLSDNSAYAKSNSDISCYPDGLIDELKEYIKNKKIFVEAREFAQSSVNNNPNDSVASGVIASVPCGLTANNHQSEITGSVESLEASDLANKIIGNLTVPPISATCSLSASTTSSENISLDESDETIVCIPDTDDESIAESLTDESCDESDDKSDDKSDKSDDKSATEYVNGCDDDCGTDNCSEKNDS